MASVYYADSQYLPSGITFAQFFRVQTQPHVDGLPSTKAVKAHMNLVPKLRLAIVGILFGGSLLWSSPASALSITLYEANSGTLYTTNDQFLGDMNGVPGAVQYTGTLGNVLFDLTLALADPIIGSPDNALLKLTQLSVTAFAAANLTVWVTDTDRTLTPATPTASFSSRVDGVILGGGTLTAASYVDPLNRLYGSSPLALGFGPLSGTFSEEASTTFNYSGPFSLTQVANVNLSALSIASFNLTSGVKNVPATHVPEPASLTLLGVGFAGVLISRSRRKNIA
jgi:hypothetical protein